MATGSTFKMQKHSNRDLFNIFLRQKNDLEN